MYVLPVSVHCIYHAPNTKKTLFCRIYHLTHTQLNPFPPSASIFRMMFTVHMVGNKKIVHLLILDISFIGINQLKDEIT